MSVSSQPLRRIVTPVLIGTALLSAVLVATITTVSTRSIDRSQNLEQLGELQRSRSQAISDAIELRRQEISVLAADRSVAASLIEFRDAMAELDTVDVDATGTSDEDRRTALRERAAGLVDDDQLRAIVAARRLDIPTVDDLVPSSVAARYLQFHYGLAGDRAARLAVDQAGDGSSYSRVHAERHPVLRQLAEDAGLRDLMLVSLEGNRTVYTVAKGPDLGVDPSTSVFGADGFGTSLAEILPRTAAGEGVLVDVQPYLGAAGEPLLFVAATVSDGTEIVGALVAQVPIDRLNRLMTAEGRWSEAGLGATGQTYVVGRDTLLRSDARGFLEDPDRHVESLSSASREGEAAAVVAAGSTVAVQRVDTAPVRTALDGRTFSGRAEGITGADTLSVAAPLGLTGLDWVVVAEVERSEALAESADLRRTLLVVTGALVALVAVIGLVLARRLTRPIGPLVDATERLASGELGGTAPAAADPALDDPSTDEFGHLARALRSHAAALAAEDASLVAEREALDELLSAVLPRRAIEAVRHGELRLCDLVDTATVVAVSGDATWFDDAGSDPGDADHGRFVSLASDLEDLARRHGVERIWSSADRHLFVAGLGTTDHGADAAVQFVLDARERLRGRSTLGPDDDGDRPDRLAVGLAAGTVTTAVVGGDHPAFGVWGEPTRLAMALAAVGEPGTVLVHGSVDERLGLVGVLEPTRTTVDLGDGPIEVGRLGDRSSAG